MANENETKTETTESEGMKFNACSVNTLGSALGKFIPTYKKFALSCRQALNSCLLHYSGGKFTVAPAETFNMNEPESSESEAFIGWFPVYTVKRVKEKKCRGERTEYAIKMEARPDELRPKVTVENTTTGDDISGDFSEATFKAIADFFKFK
jgi:hypothetical protein